MYQIDLVAIKDAKEKLNSTVVKSWQVNYIPHPEEEAFEEEKAIGAVPENLSDEAGGEEDEAMRLALEITARLAAEAAADEAVKQAEIAQALAEAEAEFNKTTGSRSGSYGKDISLDEEGMEQVDSIMDEKNVALQELIKSAMQ